jgi:hypothetical protein
MPNQKISELTAIVTVDNSVDVLPIVDISANTTKKVTPNALKTALALDNVNNTSDANKPVSIAQQDALNAKVDENAPITPGTAPKITFDAKGLVTSGDSLDETDLPTGINANKIGTGVVSSTEFGYLDGVTSAIQTQIDAKQATLVSGTNIKTINGTSLVGSGDVTINTSPSGVAGAIQFSDGSALASDATKFFWDNTNKRLGVGTNVPSFPADVVGEIRSTTQVSAGTTGTNGAFLLRRTTDGNSVGSFSTSGNEVLITEFSGSGGRLVTGFGTTALKWLGSSSQPRVGIGFNGSILATAHIQGSGSTSATTSLLVQNSAGTAALTVRDDLYAFFNGNFQVSGNSEFFQTALFRGVVWAGGTTDLRLGTNAFGTGMTIASATADVSISTSLTLNSTTKGFLPPRMTTTQKNAIVSPAAGLVVYDSTTNKLCCYNGSTWNDLF